MNKHLLSFAAISLSALLLAACGAKGSSHNSASSHNSISLMQTNELLSLDTSAVADLPIWNTLENSMEACIGPIVKMSRRLPCNLNCQTN